MNGFERIDQPGKRVIIIGAGMAGLVAGYELARAGHDPLILEAQNRVGGRVYTLRRFAPGLYAEAGAMRIPRVHDLTLGYCEHFGLELRPFLMGNPKGLVHVGGKRMTAEQAGLDPGRARLRRGRPRARPLVQRAVGGRRRSDLRAWLEADEVAGWERIVREYDGYTLREFLEVKGFSEGAIEMYGVMNFVEADMNNAVVEEFREDFGQGVRGHAGDRRRHGQPAERVLSRDPGPRPVRRRGPRDRPGRRLGHGPLQDRVGPVLGHAATTRSSRSRSRCSARSRS